MAKGCLSRQWRYAMSIALLCSGAYAEDNFLDYVTQMDETPRSSLWIEHQSSSDDSSDNYVDLGLYLNPSNKIQIGYGESQIEGISQSIETTNYSLQLIHHTKNNVDVGIGYSYWGNKDELWTETINLMLAIHGDDFSFRLQPRFTTLNIYTVPIMGVRRLGDTDSEGWSASLSYYGFENWIVNISTTDYEYDADLTKLNSFLGQIIFSNTTLLLSDNFLEKSTSLEIKWQFSHVDLGFVVSQSVSAIDHSDIDSRAINLEWFYHPDYSMFIEAGESVPESGDSGSSYVTAGFSALF